MENHKYKKHLQELIEGGKIVEVPVEKIRMESPIPYNINLLNDIERNGLINALSVCLFKDGFYYIANGRHRFACILKMGWTTAPCEVWVKTVYEKSNHPHP